MSSYLAFRQVFLCALLILCQLASPVYSEPQTNERFPEDGDDRNTFEGLDERNTGRRMPDGVEGSRTPQGGTITFPNELASSPRLNVSLELSSDQRTRTGEGRRPGKGNIPLKFLRRLAHEQDLSKIFENYVSNVKFKDSDGQKYLVDLRGHPIEVGLEAPTPPPPKIKLISEQTLMEKQSKPTRFGGYSNKVKESVLQNPERVGISTRVSKPAICEPELKTVEIPAPNDPNVIQFPKCVRLERCGGCCGSDLLTCEPARSRQTEVQVQRFAYNDETEKLEYRDTEILILPSHTQCKCNCRIKPADCSPRHAYNSEDCLCTCKNSGERELCTQKAHKLWDATLCQCVCREIKVCSSGYSFNIDSCECAVNSDRRRLGGVSDEEQNPRRNRREHLGIRLPRQHHRGGNVDNL